MKLRRPPSAKEKKRYLVFRVISENPVAFSDVKNALMNSIINWMGEKGLSVSNLRVIRNLWDSGRQEGWVTCTPKSVNDVKMALALIHQIGDSKVIFNVVRVSGTIKSAREKLVE